MIRFRSCSSMAGLLALDVHATLAQGAVVTVHDVVRQHVHGVVRSCVLEAMRLDTRSREIRCTEEMRSGVHEVPR